MNKFTLPTPCTSQITSKPNLYKNIWNFASPCSVFEDLITYYKLFWGTFYHPYTTGAANTLYIWHTCLQKGAANTLYIWHTCLQKGAANTLYIWHTCLQKGAANTLYIWHTRLQKGGVCPFCHILNVWETLSWHPRTFLKLTNVLFQYFLVIWQSPYSGTISQNRLYLAIKHFF